MFYKNSTYPDGLMSKCKQCSYKANKLNKQKLRENKHQERDNWTPDPSIFKKCISCGQEKSQMDFYYSPDYKDRCAPRCKQCESLKISNRAKERSFKNKEIQNKKFNEYMINQKKVCTSCKMEKSFEDFRFYSRTKDKLTSRCKECLVEVDKLNHVQYYEKNRELIIKKTSEFYHKNKEGIHEKTRQDRKLNPEKYKEIDKKHSLRRMGMTRKAMVDPLFKLDTHWKYLIKWQRGRCFHCLNPLLENNIHVDHIVPLSKGGSHSGENTVLSCAECNLKKNDKLLYVEWTPANINKLAEQEIYLSYSEINSYLSGKASWEINPCENGIILKGSKEIKLFVLSSFLTSEHNPYLFKRAVSLKKENPDAIILFDYELNDRLPNIINMLKSKIGIASKFPARKLNTSLISTSEAKIFLNQYHLMGFGTGTSYIGLKDDNNILFGVGAFFKKGSYFENVRLAFNGHVAGGMSKIIKGLWKLVEKLPIESFVDSRYADGGGHETIGFENLGMTSPGYRWLFPNKNKHYRYLSNNNKIITNLLWIDNQYSLSDNIKINGVCKLYMPPLHKIKLLPD
jgi:5-methylcytosine-specific restriction endonuclease McrA